VTVLRPAALRRGLSGARFSAAGLSGVLSVGAHLALLLVAVRALRPAGLAGEGERPPIEVSLEADGAGTPGRERRGEALPTAAGGSRRPRLDQGRRGKGGDAFAQDEAIHLADTDDGLRRTVELPSGASLDQIQRIEVASLRRSAEDRRAAAEPMELTWVLSGSSTVYERRDDAPTNPDRGSRRPEAPSERGATPSPSLPSPVAGSALEPVPEFSPDVKIGAAQNASSAGLRRAPAGPHHHQAAAIAFARPLAERSRVAVPAAQAGRTVDNVDSESQVADVVRSLIHASGAGGDPGQGRGGDGSQGEPGAEGTEGAGFAASPLGPGGNGAVDVDSKDPRLLPYLRRIRQRLDPLWANAFPPSAAVQLRQGTVILDFTIEEDGRTALLWPPIRPSGIDAFDRSCGDAIEQLGKLDPIPASFGTKRLRVRVPFTVLNPVVR
jgi:hypothetical protein